MSDGRRLPLFLVREVHNYGGFFGGDTVSVTVSPLDDADTQLDLTIADNVFDNLSERHYIVPDLVLGLGLDGDEVRDAHVAGARDRQALRAAMRATHEAPDRHLRPLCYRCPTCQLWYAGAPDGGGPYTCRVCGTTL